MATLVIGWFAAATILFAQQPDAHFVHQGDMPPGAIGNRRLQRGGPLRGYFQPVEIKAPPGALISLAVDDEFDAPRPGSRKAGMLIGPVYRLRVTNIHLAEGLEVFPTIEVIDRLYPPCGQEKRFAIPIQLTEEDLNLALDGKFVTRVIYVEDPRHALPVRNDTQGQNWFETPPGQDPLAVADGLGRPVAILRLGARLPDEGMDAFFFFGSPPYTDYSPDRGSPKTPPRKAVPDTPQPVAPASYVKTLPPPPKKTQAVQQRAERKAKDLVPRLSSGTRVVTIKVER